MTGLATVPYTIDTQAIAGQWTAHSAHSFDRTIAELKLAIAARDLWLIAEIDPQMLLARAGLSIHPSRQLLFFHPRYMERLLRADARALPEVPLKIVVMADAAGQVIMRGPEIKIALERYLGAGSLGQELSALCAEIVATVSPCPTVLCLPRLETSRRGRAKHYPRRIYCSQPLCGGLLPRPPLQSSNPGPPSRTSWPSPPFRSSSPSSPLSVSWPSLPESTSSPLPPLI
jgi:uncharacterized protein (DUF302 family)